MKKERLGVAISGLINVLNRLSRTQYSRHVSMVAWGAFLGQAIGVAASPILTRLYGPENFASLALFMAIVSSLTPGVCGRYEVAIVVVKEESDRRVILALCLWVASTICLGLLAALVYAFDMIEQLLNAGLLGRLLLLSPPALFLTGLLTTLKYYANNKKAYKTLSQVAVAQALVSTTLSIYFGWLGLQGSGLIIGWILALIFGGLYLLFVFRSDLSMIEWWWSHQKWAVVRRYKAFPLYNASTSLLDGVTLALPVFFLTKYYPEAVVGYYALLIRVATAPLSFISQAVSQVNMKRVAEMVHRGESPVHYLRKITLVLAGVAIAPCVVLMTMAPAFFAFIFGEKWRSAGDLLVILMPAISWRFVVSTLSGTLLSTGHLRLLAVWQVTYFIVTFTMFLQVAPHASSGVMFVAMAVTDFVLYSLYYACLTYAVRNPKEYS